MKNKSIVIRLMAGLAIFMLLTLPSFGEDYLILQKSGDSFRSSSRMEPSTREKLYRAGMKAEKIKHHFSNLDAVTADISEEEAEILKLENSDLILVRADTMLYHSRTTNQAMEELATADIPWHVLKARPLEDYAVLSGGDFSSLLIFVLDTGVDIDHPDLEDNLEIKEWAKHFYRSFNGITSNDNVSDSHGHGTQVTGTIVGDTTGVASSLRVVPIKVSEDGVLTVEILSAACNYIMGLKQTDLSSINIIINLSYNAGPFTSANKEYAPFFDELFTSLGEKEILFVGSAGNESTDSDIKYVYPTRNEASNYVAAASVNSDGKLSSFSNYGKRSVEVAAPGSSIYTTGLEGSYTTVDGTSFASPFTAGIAGLIWAIDPDLEYWEVRNLLINAIGRQDLQSNFINDFRGAEGDFTELLSQDLTGSAYETEEVEVISGKALFPLIVTDKAYAPVPGNGEEHVAFETMLEWKSGFEDVSFDLQFGTSPVSLDLVSFDLAVTSFDLSEVERSRGEPLSYDTDYFWRVDTTINSADFFEGSIWRFRTISLKPYENFPLDGTSEMETEVNLSWKYDIEGSTFDVYFSDDLGAVTNMDDGVIIASGISIPAVNLDSLDYDTTYYWRVVMHSYIQNRNIESSSNEGEIMSFTTRPPSQTDPVTSGGGGGCNVVTGLPGLLLLGTPLLLLIKRK